MKTNNPASRERIQELIRLHDNKAEEASSSLCCGSENWEYREANRKYYFHRDTANTLRHFLETLN